MSVIINIKKISFTLVNFFVFYNVINCKNEKKRCSGKCSNKDNEETIVVKLKGKSGERYEHNEKSKDNDDDNKGGDSHDEQEEDKKFDFEEHKYIQKSANFYSLSSACRSLILKIKQFDDVKVFEESLNKAKTEEELKKIKDDLENFKKERDNLINGIDGKLNKVELSLLDLGYAVEYIYLSNCKYEDLKTIGDDINKKILEYFQPKIDLLKKDIEQKFKDKLETTNEFKSYISITKEKCDSNNVAEYFVKLQGIHKKLENLYFDKLTLDELKTEFENLKKDVEGSINKLNIDDKKDDFEHKKNEIVKKSDYKEAELAEVKQNKLKQAIEEFKKLQEELNTIVAVKGLQYEVNKKIKEIDGLLNSLKDNNKYCKVKIQYFVDEFNKNNKSEEAVKKLSKKDLNTIRENLNNLFEKIVSYKKLLDEFANKKLENSDKVNKFKNKDIKIKDDKWWGNMYSDILDTYKVDEKDDDKITFYLTVIEEIYKIFEFVNDVITKIKDFKCLTNENSNKEPDKSYYFNRIINSDNFEKLKETNIKTGENLSDNQENIKNLVEKIFNEAKTKNKEQIIANFKNEKERIYNLLTNECKRGTTMKDIIKEDIEFFKNECNGDFKTYCNCKLKNKADKADKAGNKKGFYFLFEDIIKNAFGNIKNNIFQGINNSDCIKKECSLNNENIKKKIGTEYIANLYDGKIIDRYNNIKKVLLNIEIDYYLNSGKFKGIKNIKNYEYVEYV